MEFTEFDLEPEQAYGPVREDLINEVPKQNLPEGVEVGQALQAQTEQGPVRVTVVELNEEIGKVDANHPLAGKKLIFDLEVVEVGQPIKTKKQVRYSFMSDFFYLYIMNYKIGDKVIWLGNPYTILEINNKGVILKQNFSIGTVLTSPIPTEQLDLI